VDLQLTGSRVLVTGGTRGIGRRSSRPSSTRAPSSEFCARGRREIEATERPSPTRGGRAPACGSTSGTGPALTGWVEAAAGRLGGLDAVVANVSALAAGPGEETGTPPSRST
jgi:NAD(P)-dependent dehydrogenase (short-subunit alcohol dehydrogenase family)